MKLRTPRRVRREPTTLCFGITRRGSDCEQRDAPRRSLKIWASKNTTTNKTLYLFCTWSSFFFFFFLTACCCYHTVLLDKYKYYVKNTTRVSDFCHPLLIFYVRFLIIANSVYYTTMYGIFSVRCYFLCDCTDSVLVRAVSASVWFHVTHPPAPMMCGQP